MDSDNRVQCGPCQGWYKAKKDGTPYAHKCGQWQRGQKPKEQKQMNPDAAAEIEHSDAESLYAHPEGHLTGSAKDPFADPTGKQSAKGPWFPASREGECDTCGDAIYQGDEIRADGSGGWECQANCAAYDSADERVPYSGRCDHCATVHAGLCPPNSCDHSFTWADDGNGHEGSFCRHCGTPDTGELKAQRFAEARSFIEYPPGEGTEADGAMVKALDQAFSPNAEDPFSDPTQAKPPVPEFNVSGQPKARYVWRGKTNMGYQVKLPETGDFRRYKNGNVKGITRVTTFVKAASDSNALTDWAKRNVLIGASKRPDIVARAHGMTHEDNRGDLMSLVGELETVAGAKVSADIGTMIHEFTERLDGDPDFVLADIPPGYRPAVALYAQTLRRARLRPVPGLIERTTYVPEFGGVTGTWDRVYLHEPSGQYVIGDVKTGKTLEYGMDEIEAQEAIYARGANTSGAYDWNTDTWCPPGSYGDSIQTGPWSMHTVSEDWGVIVHMPVQGDDAGKCILVKADLQRGWRHAALCHQVRLSQAAKPKPEPWDDGLLRTALTAVQGPSAPTWEEAFSGVASTTDAGHLWERARAAGVEPMRLQRLVGLAQQRLRELGISS
jgi:hypothetical protein